jgi:hypothetical protein
VEYRDGDEASVPDDVEQDFHPDRHERITSSNWKFRDATFIPGAAAAKAAAAPARLFR